MHAFLDDIVRLGKALNTKIFPRIRYDNISPLLRVFKCFSCFVHLLLQSLSCYIEIDKFSKPLFELHAK